MPPTLLSPPEPGLPAELAKYWKIFRVSLGERMVYRTDFFLSTILRFLPMVTTILLWHAVFDGMKEKQNDNFNGFTLPQMVAYLLLVHISRMFSSMPGLAAGIARDIRSGELKKYLLQPIDMLAYLLSYRMAHKAAYITMSSLPYGLLFLVCYTYLPPWPDAVTLLAYVASLLLAFVIGFFLEACLGMVGFWFLEVTSFLYIVMTVNYFLSGHMFPLDILDPTWARVLKALPFQYLAYFPTMIILGKVQGEELVWGLLGAVAWAVFFVVLARVLYRLGLRRYSAYGG